MVHLKLSKYLLSWLREKPHQDNSALSIWWIYGWFRKKPTQYSYFTSKLRICFPPESEELSPPDEISLTWSASSFQETVECNVEISCSKPFFGISITQCPHLERGYVNNTAPSSSCEDIPTWCRRIHIYYLVSVNGIPVFDKKSIKTELDKARERYDQLDITSLSLTFTPEKFTPKDLY